jgi:hypothetical protein
VVAFAVQHGSDLVITFDADDVIKLTGVSSISAGQITII